MGENKCPDRQEITSYLLGQLEDVQNDAVLRHIETCDDCQASADTIYQVNDTLLSGIKASAQKEPYESETECEELVEEVKAIGSRELQKPPGVSSSVQVDVEGEIEPTIDKRETPWQLSEDPTLPPSGPATDTAKESAMPQQLGEYRIEKLLGRGGMGAVYLAHDSKLDRKLAIKAPFAVGAEANEILDRFRREARAVAQITHPNICPVYEVSEHNGQPYLAMAYIDGESLSKFVRPGKPVSVKQTLKLIRVLAMALDFAHSKGIIHRDLKPDNIMINGRKQPVIMDFGLARREGTQDTQLTQAGQLMGSPAYMSPEQVSGKVDAMGPCCDIYSLGVIMYEMLTGRRPFSGDLLAVLSQIALDDPNPPASLNKKVDRELSEICLKAMEKNPKNRFASMREFADAVTSYLERHGAPVATMAAGQVDADQSEATDRKRTGQDDTGLDQAGSPPDSITAREAAANHLEPLAEEVRLEKQSVAAQRELESRAVTAAPAGESATRDPQFPLRAGPQATPETTSVH